MDSSLSYDFQNKQRVLVLKGFYPKQKTLRHVWQILKYSLCNKLANKFISDIPVLHIHLREIILTLRPISKIYM